MKRTNRFSQGQQAGAVHHPARSSLEEMGSAERAATLMCFNCPAQLSHAREYLGAPDPTIANWLPGGAMPLVLRAHSEEQGTS